MNIIYQPVATKSYQEMYKTEDSHWWFTSLRRVLAYYLKKIKPENVLDAGCGTGVNMLFAGNLGFDVSGFDISKDAIDLCIKKRNLTKVQVASITCIPFESNYFDLTYSMDVITTLDENDRRSALRELCRCTKKGGYLLLNLAALDWLYSAHDIQWRVKKRYDKKSLTTELESCGFKVEKITYRYFIIFPFIALVKILEKLKLKSNEDLDGDFVLNNHVINTVLNKVMFVEDMFIRYISFPIGSSIFVFAKKI